jgi:hypothetical protein
MLPGVDEGLGDLASARAHRRDDRRHLHEIRASAHNIYYFDHCLLALPEEANESWIAPAASGETAIPQIA